MKLLVDAQLPQKLARWLEDSGHDAIHTLDLEKRNRTPDSDLIRWAEAEQRILITKDSDFVESRVLTGNPHRLLLISTGNIRNRD